MLHYANRSRNAGISAYEVRPRGLVLQFADGSCYLYTYDVPGKHHVEEMKRLAAAGRGLTTYVNQHVGAAYAEKIR